MLAYKNYLDNMGHEELVALVLRNKQTVKAVRNHLILKEFMQIKDSGMPRMDVYSFLAENHKVSERTVIELLRA